MESYLERRKEDLNKSNKKSNDKEINEDIFRNIA